MIEEECIKDGHEIWIHREGMYPRGDKMWIHRGGRYPRGIEMYQ